MPIEQNPAPTDRTEDLPAGNSLTRCSQNEWPAPAHRPGFQAALTSMIREIRLLLNPRGRSVTLSALLSVIILLSFPVLAEVSRQPIDNRVRSEEKLSPRLRQKIDSFAANPKLDAVPIIVQLTPSFFTRNAHFQDESSPANKNALPLINAYRARLTAAQIRLLSSSPDVDYVTLDVPIRSSSDLEGDGHWNGSPFLASIGADQLGTAGYSGDGVTVAVFDSGIQGHPDLETSRIVAAVDFTSGSAVRLQDSSDRYGHGTAIAGIIGGTGKASQGTYAGVAPAVSFVDVRVVGEDGTGLTSNLVKAIEWVIEHKQVYGIDVANLSVGHPPVESYQTDPLCQAAQKLVAAGIVTVASAGNTGKTEQHPKIWGAINSPANDPTVIAVYPVNTRGTATRDDDTSTSYGSRGPSYPDRIFKPDLAAPGNAIPSLLAKGSTIDVNHFSLQISEHYIELSGASMATAFVTGSIALLLEAHPELSPSLVKLLLLRSATGLQQAHILEQGHGLLNSAAAVRLARLLEVSENKAPGVRPSPWFSGWEDLSNHTSFSDRHRIPDHAHSDPALLHNSGRVTDRSQSCLNAIEFALTQACPDLPYDSAPHI